ncbi:helix-turn-helix transcriptional regulator [Rhizomonospora bruguierae]|uniref:helix-turn-helix transcriptional regulator n=1 Tax=Rhizomonospora bruguierae TaxID=1581705 RepID=UPI001BCE9CFC|nr:LuxR family transcriptional regulator [Micromonospora sp. NBRC 107566]
MTTDHAQELEALTRLLDESSRSSGQLVLIQGELACGQTELLQEFAQCAAASGALLLTATGSWTENDLQAGLIDQLIRCAGIPAEIVERLERLVTSELLTGAGVHPKTANHHEVSTIVQEICGVLLEFAQIRPVVIAIEDVQLADRTSLLLLLHLVRRLRSARILIVLTEWEWPQRTMPLFRVELTRRPRHLIRLAPLSREATAELVGRSLGEQVGPRLVAAFHDLTGGNPVLLRALIEDHIKGDPDPDRTRVDHSPAVGRAYGRAVLEVLLRGEDRLLRVAQGMAVLGSQSTPELLGRLMDLRVDAVERLLRMLSVAGLLVGGHFRHPKADAAVLDTLSAEERAAAHIRAAELLYRRGAPAIEVARQLLTADAPAQPWMVPVLRAAAEQAADDVQVALRCLELARRAAEDPGDQLAITAALARTVWMVNPSAAAPYIPALRAAILDGSLRSRDAMSVVRYLLWNGYTDGAVAALEGLTSGAPLNDPRLLVEMRLAFRWYVGVDHKHLRTSKPNSSPAEPWSHAVDQLATVGNPKESATATDCANRILQSCQLQDSTVEVVVSAVLALASCNRLERAAWWCDQLIEEAQRRKAVVWQALLRAVRAAVALRSGDVLGAIAQAQEALTLLPPERWGVLVGYPLSTLVSACTAAGRFDNAAEALRHKVPEAMYSTAHGLRYLHARGQYQLASDRVLAAVSDFQSCGRMAEQFTFAVPLPPWRCSLAEANLRLGRVRAARELVRHQLEQVKVMDDRTRGAALRILAATSDLTQRRTLLTQAVKTLETAGDRIELVRTLEDLGRVHQQLGEFDQARQLTRRATQESRAGGVATAARPAPTGGPGHEAEPAPAAAATAPVPQRRIGAAELSVLSHAQRRVAELAALGHSNQEISRRLYITVSTVEQHLTRVFRKLGVNNRNDLVVSLYEPA